MEFKFDENSYIDLLTKLMSHSENLQNGGERVARERLALDEVLKVLNPYIEEGVIKCDVCEYKEGRPNVIFKYMGTTEKSIGFVGSHFDVVPADPKQWKRNPFKLTIEGDELHGRGTTDCLGHVALLTLMLAELGKNKPELDTTIGVVFIADEEVGEDDSIGVKHVYQEGKLDFLHLLTFQTPIIYK